MLYYVYLFQKAFNLIICAEISSYIISVKILKNDEYFVQLGKGLY